MSVTISASKENKEILKTAFLNAGIPINVEPPKKPEDPLKFSILSHITSLSILLHVIENNPESYKGTIILLERDKTSSKGG